MLRDGLQQFFNFSWNIVKEDHRTKKGGDLWAMRTQASSAHWELKPFWLFLFRQKEINSWGGWWDMWCLVALIKESKSVRCPQSFLRCGVCLHSWLWIYSRRWVLYFSWHPWGRRRDILQHSRVPHKNCQWGRSEDFSKTTAALMHSNTLH